MSHGRPVAGIERGVFGFGIRGVSPVRYKETIVGTVEMGLSFDKAFLEDFHRHWKIDLALFNRKEKGNYELMVNTGKEKSFLNP